MNGQPIRESTETEKETKARRILKDLEGRIASGQPAFPRAGRIRYEEAAAHLRTHYRTTGEREEIESETRFAHLDPWFRGRRISEIGGADISRYVAARQAEGVVNGTINRELGVLSRMLSLAYENRKLLRLPVIHRLKEAKPREGFFERGQFEAVKRHLQPDLQVAVSLEYAYGWRCQSEVLTLKRSQVDLGACTIRLDPGTTKNDEGRLVYLAPELLELLQAQEERVQLLEMELGRPVPWLFPHFEKRYLGRRVQHFRVAWQQACLEAGCPGMLRHDFRRTAVRNMVNRGVPERVAMKAMGHRTRSVFDRYHIVSPADLQEAARKLAGTLEEAPAHAEACARATALFAWCPQRDSNPRYRLEGARQAIFGHYANPRNSLETCRKSALVADFQPSPYYRE